MILIWLLCLAAPVGFSSELDFRNDGPRLEAYVGKFAASFSWKEILKDAPRVVYLGERHPVSDVRDELIASMREIKEAGITHLGIEMLTQEYREPLRRYCCNGECEAEVEKGLEWFGHDPPSYKKLIDAATAVGIVVVPLDLEEAIRDKVRKERDHVWYHEVVPSSGEEFDRSLAKWSKIKDDLMCARDKTMARNIADVLDKNDTARFLVLTGAAHNERDRQPRILKDLGYDSRTYRTTSGEKEIRQALRVNNLEDHRLLIPATGKEMGYDGFFHLPNWPGAETATTTTSSKPSATHR